MVARLTQDDFIKRCQERHGCKYDFSKSVYVKNDAKVIVTCLKHGEFLGTPSALMVGRGCKKCALESNGARRKLTTEQYVEKAVKVHGKLYDYSRVDYTFSKNKIKIICRVHGEFEVVAAQHLAGSGCDDCADAANGYSQRKGTSKFIEEAKALYDNLYDYSLVEYITNKTPVKIICKAHGEFLRTPADHLFKKIGCAACSKSGFKKDKPANFYILKTGNLTKIGITNREVDERLRTINKSSNKNFETCSVFCFEYGEYAAMLEIETLDYLSKFYKNPNEIFDGYTETFEDVDLQDLVSKIESLINEQNSSSTKAQ